MKQQLLQTHEAVICMHQPENGSLLQEKQLLPNTVHTHLLSPGTSYLCVNSVDPKLGILIILHQHLK